MLSVVLVGAFAVISNPARHFLLTWGAQRYRESVLVTRPSLNPNAPENLKYRNRGYYSATVCLRSESAQSFHR